MKDEIENLINEKLNKIEEVDQETLKRIEEMINNQNNSLEEQEQRRKMIKKYIQENHIKNFQDLTEKDMNNLIHLKIDK